MMEQRLYRELWHMRFEKRLRLEEKGASDCERLLEECRLQFKGHAIIPHLEKLVGDEQRHVTLVKELIKILDRQKR